MNTLEMPAAEFAAYANFARENMHSKPRFELMTSDGSIQFTPYTIAGDYQGAVLSVPDKPEIIHQYGSIAVEDFQQYSSNWGLSRLPGRQVVGDAQTISTFEAA